MASDKVQPVGRVAFKRSDFLEFETQRGADGKVRAGVWDRVCVPGHDEKDGQSTDFNEETLSQFVDNFVERGDPIPLDHNHQSQYASKNGQPAPALGWYGALAVVSGGKVVKVGAVKDVDASVTDGLDLGRDGLWCLRSEVTELGQSLLPNFKLLSPTFTTEGSRRDGTPCGYSLCAVAATNTPHQSGTEITFSSTAVKSGTNQGARMAKLASVAKLIKMEGDADDATVKQALLSKMEDEAMEAASDEKFDYAAHAAQYEELAKAYEDAHADPEDDNGPPPQEMLRKMASKFRKLSAPPAPAAMADEEDKAKMADEEKKAKMADDKEKDDGAKFAVMEASHKALQEQLARLNAREDEREKAEKAEKDRALSAFADAAVSGGYPKDSRDALISFARSDFAAARSAVATFLPKSGAPAHLFERATSNGAPIGRGSEAREVSGPAKPKRIVAMNRTFVEDDGEFADKIKETAESKDPVIMAKVDKYLAPKERPVLFNRLLAAEKIVRAERPDLAASADGE